MRLVKEALSKNNEELYNTQMAKDDFGNAKILVVGCGGAGNNTIHRLSEIGIEGAETIAINTDKQHLEHINADKKILIGSTLTRGLGAGGYPEIGKKSAELAKNVLEDVIKSADLIFVAAGMGGGTGTGSAPVVAEIAKENGAVVIGVVTYPFKIERARLKKADEGLRRLTECCDTVIVIDNNRLVDFVPNLPMNEAFRVADEIIAQAVKGITETISLKSLINIDYADVKAVMTNGGVAMIGVGEVDYDTKGDRVEKVVKDTLQCPLLDIDYKGATGALIHITGGPDLTLGEANRIGDGITSSMDINANVIWGARLDPSMDGAIRVMAIITGVKSPNIMGGGKSHQKIIPNSANRSKGSLGIDYIV
ncbi:cell division protein FtsZ [Methanococcus maripaludis]|jgi:cell division protein FtsZ|uniref:Cell division protein FtsZ n=4 Tax=Methanococcus maripaludis TaxID=39152 RepID=Q6LX52_METMP|nr:cell division protein FtsZ [Methanococcus maripaludis]MDK2928933.1 cell division protein FtsZ [Methanococcus sp.]AEK20521.1 cell division protein FtsZ [Methanococcus maripaludis X1]AVB76717.1 Cell division protein FtsZ [Methanococcus maripaludis]MBA2847400.1 cell division protein FtsZ [Methanococcus maripaludis]MBA2850095.1 cell division protein FtsZ [Methanococcus maripaludis]